MKKLIFLAIPAALLFSCSSGSESKTAATADTTASAPAAPAANSAVSAASEKGLELIGASDCTTCHRLQKASAGASIGPAYSEVAAKYANAADTTVNRLVAKIISGGAGIWGAVPMTPHPAVPEADVRVMVQYILSIK